MANHDNSIHSRPTGLGASSVATKDQTPVGHGRSIASSPAQVKRRADRSARPDPLQATVTLPGRVRTNGLPAAAEPDFSFDNQSKHLTLATLDVLISNIQNNRISPTDAYETAKTIEALAPKDLSETVLPRVVNASLDAQVKSQADRKTTTLAELGHLITDIQTKNMTRSDAERSALSLAENAPSGMDHLVIAQAAQALNETRKLRPDGTYAPLPGQIPRVAEGRQ